MRLCVVPAFSLYWYQYNVEVCNDIDVINLSIFLHCYVRLQVRLWSSCPPAVHENNPYQSEAPAQLLLDNNQLRQYDCRGMVSMDHTHSWIWVGSVEQHVVRCKLTGHLDVWFRLRLVISRLGVVQVCQQILCLQPVDVLQAHNNVHQHLQHKYPPKRDTVLSYRGRQTVTEWWGKKINGPPRSTAPSLLFLKGLYWGWCPPQEDRSWSSCSERGWMCEMQTYAHVPIARRGPSTINYHILHHNLQLTPAGNPSLCEPWDLALFVVSGCWGLAYTPRGYLSY